MKDVAIDSRLVAYCGLYCGACGAYLKGRCPGCHDNVKATWCKIRACCAENALASCADCNDFADPADCRKFDNLISRILGVLLNSNRRACVFKIRELGLQQYAELMSEAKRQTLPRRAP